MSALHAIVVVGGVVLEPFLFASVSPSEWSDIVTIALDLPAFLVNPVLLFYVFYRLGKKVRLKERYVSVGAGVFVGGVLGGLAYYPLLLLVRGSSLGVVFPDLLSAIGWTIAFLLGFVGYGLGALFPGFVAITIANFRRKEQLGPEELMAQSKADVQQPEA